MNVSQVKNYVDTMLFESKDDSYSALTKEEVAEIGGQIEGGMRTTNGDTAPVTLTARQASIVLGAYLEMEEVED